MDAELLERLSQTTDPAALDVLICEYRLTLDTIQELKTNMETFAATEPSEGLRMAQVAYRLGLRMPMPAPALGRWTLANALLYTNRYQEAAQLYQQARDDYLAAHYKLDAARMAVGQVGVLAYIGESKQALALANEVELLLAASSATNPTDLLRLGSLLMNVGVVHDLVGQYEEALAVYARLIPIATQLNDQLMLAQVEHNQAYALAQIGAFDEATKRYGQAEALFLALDAKAELARLYINLSTLLGQLNWYEQALTVQNKAEEQLFCLAGMEQPRHRLALLRAHFCLQSHHSIDQALLDALQAAQVAFAQHGPLLEEGLALVFLGHCYIARGDWTTARQKFEEAHKCVEKDGDSLLGYRILQGLGEVERGQNCLENAIHYYETAIRQIEAIRYGLQIETFRAGFLTDKLEVYQGLTDLYLQKGNLELAFQTVEWAKSRLMMEKLTFRLTTEVQQAVESADEQIRELGRQLTVALQTLDQLYDQAWLETRQSQADLSYAPPRQTASAVEKLEADVQHLVQQIQRRQPLFSALTAGYTSSLASIQHCLGDAIFLQYHLINDQVCVFLLNRMGLQQHVKLAKLTEVNQARNALVRITEQMLDISVRFGVAKAARYLPKLLEQANKHLKSLYMLLVGPLLDALPANAPLIISPDGPLVYVPFHALYDGQAYLIERRAVSYTPSATVFDLCMQHQASGTGVLLFGYTDGRLPSIAYEIEELARLFPTAEVYTDAQATTTQFMDRVAHQRLIHLAAHARFRMDNPMLSAISLADRRLTLAEIARLQLNADLVVLSGCATGYGQLHGTDLLSLAGGFLGAGARALLVSLWRVEDTATATLIHHFYQALQAGQSHADALRTAQLALLHQGRHSSEHAVYGHPAYWAPFVLIGKR